jgi:hypothetical protein
MKGLFSYLHGFTKFWLAANYQFQISADSCPGG